MNMNELEQFLCEFKTGRRTLETTRNVIIRTESIEGCMYNISFVKFAIRFVKVVWSSLRILYCDYVAEQSWCCIVHSKKRLKTTSVRRPTMFCVVLDKDPNLQPAQLLLSDIINIDHFFLYEKDIWRLYWHPLELPNFSIS